VYWKKENDRRNTSIHLKLGEMEKRVMFEWSRIMEEQKRLEEENMVEDKAIEDKISENLKSAITCRDIDKTTKVAKQKLKEEAKEIDRKSKEAKQKLIENSKKVNQTTELMNKAMRLLKNYGPRCGLADDIINVLTANHIEMDRNGDLIAFENGIYDLSVGEWIKPHYKQYVSMTTGWNWNFRIQSDHRCMNGLLKQIFPNQAIRDHYLTILSTGLWGKQIEKIFNAQGKGGNGKGLLNSLMMHAIGDYGYNMPSLVLTDNMKDGPNPVIVNLHKKRFVVCAEPDAKKTIKGDTVKILTGENKITTRQLYESITDVILWITLIMECNGQPNFDEMNDAIARRLDVIPFVSSFKEKYKYDDEVQGMTEEEIRESNIYVADMYFKSDEFKNNNKQALIEILFEYFTKFRKNGYTFVDTPKECKEATNAYMEKSDNTYGWFCENYEKGDGIIFIKDIFNEYKLSDLYLNMTKQEKRNNNLRNFKNEIQTNVFLQKSYRNADTYYDKKKICQPYIVGYVEINKRKYMGGGFEEEIEETKE
jgi:P4 family phage/plasmid primase-like protien